MTVYDVSLSEAFAAKLRENRGRENSSQPARHQDPASLTLRFSVPPDTLESHKSELELRRTTRGEFTLQQATDTNGARDQGQGQVQGQGAAGPPGPTFKGPATVASDVECVLVYNQQSKQYELHPIGLDLQMAPALKPRTKPSSGGAKSVLREPPASLKPPISRQSSARPGSSGTGAAGSSAASTNAPASASVPTSSTSTPLASPKLGALAGPTQAHHSTAMLPPRRATTARLPTRRTLKKAKPPQTTPASSRAGSVEPDQLTPAQRQAGRSTPLATSMSAPQSAQSSPRASPQKRATPVSGGTGAAKAAAIPASRTPTYEAMSAAPSPTPATNLGAADAARRSEPQVRALNASTHSSAPSPTLLADEDDGDDSRFDDDLDDLADELADELGEDDDNPTPASASTAVGIGTALNASNDGEDTSEEE